MVDLKKISNMEFGGIEGCDYPDYCDAYIVSAWHDEENRALTDNELEWVNDQSDFVYEKVIQHIF
jgi:hypothetical protein